MTPEQATALIVAVTGLVAAIAAATVQIRGLRRDVNGRMTQLLERSESAARKLGELEGRDFMRRLQNPPPVGELPTREGKTPHTD